MYCIKCGTNNSDEAKFCRKCGELIEAEEETRVAVRPGEDGEIGRRGDGEILSGRGDGEIERRGDRETGSTGDGAVFSIGPTLKFVKVGYVLAALGALLLVAMLSIFSVTFWIALIFGLLLFLIPAYYHVRQKLVRYTLTDTQIEVDAGLISRTTRNIPLRRVQDVTVTTSAMQRLLGFGDIVIDNASEEGGKVVLDNIDSPNKYADLLLKQMHRLDK